MKTKSSWPRIIKAGNSRVKIYKRTRPGRADSFELCWYDEQGKRKTEAADTEPEAITRAEQKAATLSTHGAKVAATTPQQLAEFVRASEMLAPFSVDVFTGCAMLERWLRKIPTLDGIERALSAPTANGVNLGALKPGTVAEVMQLYFQSHRDGETSEIHLHDLEKRLPKLLKPFACNVATITTAQLQTSLDDSNGGAANYEHNRRVLSSFFGWCYSEGYHAENIAKSPRKSERAPGKTYLKTKLVPKGDVHVFKPAEMQAMLTKATSDEIKTLLAFCGFAGLRTSEFSRLRWQDVDFENCLLLVGELTDKNGKRKIKTAGSWRTLKMSPNLCAWLASLKLDRDGKPRTGFIWSNRDTDYRKTDQRISSGQKSAARCAGLKWRKNALRHSCISFRIRRGDNVADIARDCGTSVRVIESNYKALRFADTTFISPNDSAAWFAIMPPNS